MWLIIIFFQGNGLQDGLDKSKLVVSRYISMAEMHNERPNETYTWRHHNNKHAKSLQNVLIILNCIVCFILLLLLSCMGTWMCYQVLYYYYFKYRVSSPFTCMYITKWKLKSRHHPSTHAYILCRCLRPIKRSEYHNSSCLQ